MHGFNRIRAPTLPRSRLRPVASACSYHLFHDYCARSFALRRLQSWVPVDDAKTRKQLLQTEKHIGDSLPPLRLSITLILYIAIAS
jgi:hypothetical protein